ncbi:MAG: hypothetical protein K8L97_06680 [Anaerolineae bacterium]|nr:hypothetical protein [Anaerolineae bacterium]
MPLQIGWYIPYRVIDERIWGKITAEVMQQHQDMIVQMLNEAQIHAPDTRIHLLLDTTETESMPPVYMMLKTALPVLRFKNRGIMFHITRSSAIRNIIELTAHITQFQLQSYFNREEAIRTLEAKLFEDDSRAAD